MIKANNIKNDLARSKKRMTISTGPSFLIRPLQCKADTKNNPRTMSLRAPANTVRSTVDNFWREDQEKTKNDNGTIV